MMCRRCDIALVLDIGPADDPDQDGNVVVDLLGSCPVCGAEQALPQEPITAEWVRRRRAEVRR